ncbi:MAG TPA: ATP-binding protein [Chloroflexota bacterium]|nr:ATP-binding protein [Chloroflexota bacterium]
MTETTQPAQGQAQAELFRLLVSSVKDYAIFALDPTGRILSWNEGAQRIKGYTPEEIIGRHFSIFYPANDVRQGKPDYALRVAADAGQWQEEGWRLRKGGARFWASVVITALYDGDRLVGFAKVTRDLTERRRGELERLQLLELEQAARERADAALERLESIQRVTDTALAHLTLDDLLSSLLDRIAESLHVDTVALMLRDDDDSNVIVTRAVKGLDVPGAWEARFRIGDGFAGRVAAESRPVIVADVLESDVGIPALEQGGVRSLLGVPLIAAGNVLGVLHVGSRHRREFAEQDIQLLQIVADRVSLAIDHARMYEAERAARSAADVAEARARARDEFLSIAAHELKTPMASVQLAAQALLRRMELGVALDKVALERSVRVVGSQIDRLSRLVTQLLETVRVEAGRLELDRTPTDLVDLVQRVLEHMQAQLTRHEIVVHAPESLWAEVDSLRIEEVMINLVDNAIKFSPDGGPIDIDLERVGTARTRLSVRDRGIGVAPHQRCHLFERFYQAHGSGYRSGMGLGLYISRQIVELHGGSIEAKFPADGGTRVIVELPLQVSEEAVEVVA